MSTSVQHPSGRWTHGKITVSAKLSKRKPSEFGYGNDPDAKIFEYRGKYYVQVRQHTWEIGPIEKEEVDTTFIDAQRETIRSLCSIWMNEGSHAIGWKGILEGIADALDAIKEEDPLFSFDALYFRYAVNMIGSTETPESRYGDLLRYLDDSCRLLIQKKHLVPFSNEI